MLGELGAVMKLLGNRDKMQTEIAKLAETTGRIVGDGSAGGYVSVRVNGRMEVLAVQIADHTPMGDRKLLEDLIVAATNIALTSARSQVAAETQKMAAGLGLPASMLGGLPGFS